MKKNSLKELIWSLILMALPILYALFIYRKLPAQMPIHFSMAGDSNHLVAKPLAVFALPIVMMFLQTFIYWTTLTKEILNKNFEKFVRWVIPVIFTVLYLSTIYRSMNEQFDIRKIAAMVVALVFIIVGNYLPKKVQADKQPVHRSWAYLLRGLGLLFLLIGLFWL